MSFGTPSMLLALNTSNFSPYLSLWCYLKFGHLAKTKQKTQENIFIEGYLNGCVGKDIRGFEIVHGGQDFE